MILGTRFIFDGVHCTPEFCEFLGDKSGTASSDVPYICTGPKAPEELIDSNLLMG